ncbi:MAG: sortase [Patescibacteria group bacterium]
MAKRFRARGTQRRTRESRPGFLRFLARPFTRQWPFVLIAAGLALLLYSGLNGYYYDRAIQPSVTVPVTEETAAPSQPVRLTIDDAIDEKLKPQRFENGEWTVSEDAGSYMNGSAKPGEQGNIIVYGHNKGDIFGPLTDLEGTERVTVTTKDGKKYAYRIVSLKEVSTDQTGVLMPTEKEVLTVYTCSGWLDSKRFVVRAEPV